MFDKPKNYILIAGSRRAEPSIALTPPYVKIFRRKAEKSNRYSGGNDAKVQAVSMVQLVPYSRNTKIKIALVSQP
jgi:hypothetical protein